MDRPPTGICSRRLGEFVDTHAGPALKEYLILREDDILGVIEK